MSHWIFSGTQEHWEKALRVSTWGVEPGSHTEKDCWQRLKAGDIAFFYATKPVQGIIGYGIVKRPHKSSIQIWNQLREKKHDYECRAPFETVFHILDDGSRKSIHITDLKPQVSAAINKTKEEKMDKIWKRIGREWNKRKPSWLWRKTVTVRSQKTYAITKGFLLFGLGFLADHFFEIGHMILTFSNNN